MNLEPPFISPALPFSALSLHVNSQKHAVIGGFGKIALLDSPRGVWKVFSLPQKELVTSIISSVNGSFAIVATSSRNIYKIVTPTLSSIVSLAVDLPDKLVSIFYFEEAKKVLVFMLNGAYEKLNAYTAVHQGLRNELGFEISCVALARNSTLAIIGTPTGACHRVKIDTGEVTGLLKLEEPVLAVCKTFDDQGALFGTQSRVTLVHLGKGEASMSFDLEGAPLRYLSSDFLSRCVLLLKSDGLLVERSFDSEEELNKVQVSNGCFFLFEGLNGFALFTVEKNQVVSTPLKNFGRAISDSSKSLIRELKDQLRKVREDEQQLILQNNQTECDFEAKLEQEFAEKEREVLEFEASVSAMAARLAETRAEVKTKRINAVKCISCYERPANIWFEPCNHIMMCKECLIDPKAAEATRRCLLCKMNVTRKIEIIRHLKEYPELI